ncbi:LmbU family transcriptional regulator [Nonomuraea sp. NPDC049695]|uniref:LmbU family transcriptional regulator n=1 Tax=Nonomuraea sp. NPDC049695 TaxID=3154734 RepID=UPI0034135B02
MTESLLDPAPPEGHSRRPGTLDDGVTRRARSVSRSAPPGERLGLDASVRARRLGLRLPDDLSFESWEKVGDQLNVIADSSTWWLADWLVFGEESFPDRYRAALARTSLSYKTLRNYAWVARKIPMSRRRDTLSMQHHAEVAALPEGEQEMWLTRAARENWPLSRLRKEIQAGRAGALRPQPVSVTVTVQVSSEREERWKAAAEVASVPLLEWIALTLDRAAVHGGIVM